MDEEPGLLIEDVYAIDVDAELIPYPLHTEQRYLFMNTDDVMSMLDPTKVIVTKYKKLVNQ